LIDSIIIFVTAMDRNLVIRNLDRAFWDIEHDPEGLYKVLHSEVAQSTGIDQNRLFRRLLETYNWYTVLDMVPAGRLPDLLSPAVTDALRNASLRKRYNAIARILYPATLSASR
jgi:hypothetical protein